MKSSQLITSCWNLSKLLIHFYNIHNIMQFLRANTPTILSISNFPLFPRSIREGKNYNKSQMVDYGHRKGNWKSSMYYFLSMPPKTSLYWINLFYDSLTFPHRKNKQNTPIRAFAAKALNQYFRRKSVKCVFLVQKQVCVTPSPVC